VASNTPDTSWVVAALARLTAESGKPVKHGRIFKVVVTSSDGVRCGVPIRIDTHPEVVRPYALNQIADSLRLARADIMDVLDLWTHEQLVEHLSRFTQEQLRPVRLRR
jgi:hypothetical protein